MIFYNKIKSGWIATGVVNILAWTIKTDTTNFYSPWVAMIWWDIFTYTWKLQTKLAGYRDYLKSLCLR